VVAGLQDGAAGAISEHLFKARPGYHLAPVPMPNGGNTYNLLSAGFTLIVLKESEAEQLFVDAAMSLSIPLEVARMSLDSALLSYECSLILVRPDHFIAWCGDQIPNALEVLRMSTGRME
jgi:hypothetical protein